MKTLLSLPFGLVCLSLAVPSAKAALVYVEGINGELSGTGGAPTPIVLGAGVSTITGMMGNDANGVGTGVDSDIFTFTLAPGESLTGIRLTAFNPTTSVNTGSFIAIAPGTSINEGDPSGHLSNALVGPGSDVLAAFVSGPAFGGTGLTSPVPAGTYTMWFRETSTSVGYTLEFTVVPEPAVFGLALLGALPLCCRRRR